MQLSYSLVEKLPFNDPVAEISHTIGAVIPELTNVVKNEPNIDFTFSSSIAEQDLLDAFDKYHIHPDTCEVYKIHRVFMYGYDLLELKAHIISELGQIPMFTISSEDISIRFLTEIDEDDVADAIKSYVPAGYSAFDYVIDTSLPNGFLYSSLKTHIESTTGTVDIIWAKNKIKLVYDTVKNQVDITNAVNSYTAPVNNIDDDFKYKWSDFKKIQTIISLERLKKYCLVDAIFVSEDEIYINFTSEQLGENLVRDFNNDSQYEITLYNDIGNDYFASNAGDVFLSKQPTEFIVSKEGQFNYSTIKEAIANIPVNSSAIVKVYPGTYVEDNPIILPTNCVLMAAGSAITTTIVAANPASAIIDTGSWCIVDGFTIAGGAVGVYYTRAIATAYTIIRNCLIANCVKGVFAEDSLTTASLLISRTSVALNTAVANAVAVHAHNGSIIATELIIAGGPTTMFLKGICADESSRVTVATFSVYYATTAIEVDGNLSEIRGSQMYLIACGTALYFGPNELSRMIVAVVNIENCTNDIHIAAANANVEIMTAHLDTEKIVNPNNVKISGLLINKNSEYKLQALTGDVSIGSSTVPTNLIIGAGMFNIAKMLVYTYDGVTYSDVSTTMRVKNDASLNILNQNESVFIANNDKKVSGFNLKISSADTINRSNIRMYYHNGTTWVRLRFMYTNTTTKKRVSSIQNDAEYSVFIQSYTPSLVTINGVEKYWLKIDMVAAKVIDCLYITIHTDSISVDAKGALSKRGDARTLKSAPIVGNILEDGISGEKKLYLPLPVDIDVSSEVKFSFLFTTAADLTFEGDAYAGQYIEVIYNFGEEFDAEYIILDLTTTDIIGAVDMKYYAWY